MTFDPKVAAGGVAVVAIGGGAGVAIHQGTSNSSKEQTIKKLGIQIAIENAGFEIKEEDNTCNDALGKNFDETNYKAAVVACAKKNTFKKRAEELSLTPLNTSTITGNSEWTSKWTSQQETIKTLQESGETAWNSINEGSQKIKEYCDSASPFEKSAKTEDWHKFLKICIKEDEKGSNKSTPLTTALTKDFWHNKETIRSKMKTANFEEKTNSPCQADELLQPYEKGKSEEVISKCISSTTLEARAKKLNLDTLPASDNENNWNDNWTKNKEKIKKAVGETFGTNEDQWTSAKTKVQTFCTSKGKTTISKSITNTIWHNYLTACTKDKASPSTPNLEKLLTKDFWTGEEKTQ